MCLQNGKCDVSVKTAEVLATLHTEESIVTPLSTPTKQKQQLDIFRRRLNIEMGNLFLIMNAFFVQPTIVMA